MGAAMNRKERMLNAYRGKKNDRFAVAPELWSYYPAKLMKAKMVEFEREIPFWKSLQYAFNYFQCEGWGSVFSDVMRDDCKVKSDFVRIGEGWHRNYAAAFAAVFIKVFIIDPVRSRQ